MYQKKFFFLKLGVIKRNILIFTTKESLECYFILQLAICIQKTITSKDISPQECLLVFGKGHSP